MTETPDPLVTDLEVELALRGFAGRVDDDTHHVWRRKAAPSMRVRVRRDGGRAARLRGDLRCDGVGVLRFGRRSGKETLGVDAVLSTIDAWLARARRAESSVAPTPGGLADEDRWITAVELTPAATPPAAPDAPEPVPAPEPAPEPDVGPEPGAPLLPDVASAGATSSSLPAVVDDLTGELRATLAENRSLHRELGDARERAARAETESAFLAQRLQEVRETAAALGELRRRLEDTRAGEAEARARADVAEAELDRLRRELDRARDPRAAPPATTATASVDTAATAASPSVPPQPRPAPSVTSARSGRSTTIEALRRFFGPGRRGG